MARLLTLSLAALLAAPGALALSCFQCSDMDGPFVPDSGSGGGGGSQHPFLQAVPHRIVPRCAEFDAEDDRFKMETCRGQWRLTCAKAEVDGKVVRGCFDRTLEEGCQTDDDLTVCVCTGDYCNGAGTPAPALLLLLPAAALTAALLRV